MSKFFMMMGLPASGKSTYAIKLSLQADAVIHSSDYLRGEMFGNENAQDNNNELFQELHRRIKKDLKDGKNVIYDACNISYKRRMAFLEEIKKYDCEKIAIMVATPYTKCIEQNGQRDRQVPEHVIRKMYLNIFIPQYYEGWDKIHIIYNSYDYIADAGELFYGDNGLDYIDQETPYHTLTIGEHCKKCFTLCKELTNDFDLLTASLYHDIGKRFVKEYNEEKGYYVYYQHHLVSAYDSMFYLSPLNDKRTLTVVGYITWHMQLHFTLSAKSTQKFINLVGKEFYDNLLILHQADINAK